MAPDRTEPVTDVERPPLRLPAIVSTARAMIESGGIESLSLRRLAGRLGVTAPALYAHVSDKATLLRFVAEQEFGALIGRLEAIDEPDPVERLREYGRAYVAHARANPELFRTMFLFPPDVLADGMEDYELPIASKAFALAASAVEDAVGAGRMPGADPLLAALAFWSGAHGVATVLNLDPGIAGGLSEVGDALVETVIDRMIAGFTGVLPPDRA